MCVLTVVRVMRVTHVIQAVGPNTFFSILLVVTVTRVTHDKNDIRVMSRASFPPKSGFSFKCVKFMLLV